MKMNCLPAIMAGLLAVPSGLLSPAAPAPQPQRLPGAHRGHPVHRQLSIPPPPLSATAQSVLSQPGRHICYVAYVNGTGWQSWGCDGATAGTAGQDSGLAALTIAVSPGFSGVCAVAHVPSVSWQDWTCTSHFPSRTVTVGTTGEGRQLDALSLYLPGTSGMRTICAQANMQRLGWTTGVCGPAVMAGNTGLGLRMEGLRLRFPVP